MADPRLTIRISAQLDEIKRALGTVQQDLGKFKQHAEKTTAGMTEGMRTAGRVALQLGAALGAAFSLRNLAQMTDEVQEHTARLKLATRSAEEFNKAQQQTFAIAQRTRTSLKATGELYARIERSTKELGLSQEKVLQLTETINQAAQISGGGQGAEAALFQLSQGLAAGQLRGEELNSVLEQTPRLAQAIAEGLDMPIGKLREFATEGKLTAEQVMTALAGQADVLAAEFAQMPKTIAGGFTQIRNSFLQYLATSPAVMAVTQAIAGALAGIANNMPAVIAAVVGLGTALAVAFAPGLLTAFATQLKAVYALIVANPFGALAVAIAGVLAAVTVLRDEIKLGVDDTTTLGDLMRAAWKGITQEIDFVSGEVQRFFSDASKASGATFEEMTANADEAGKYQEALWLRILRTVVQVFDMIGGTIRGALAGIGAVISQQVGMWIDTFGELGNATSALLRGDFAGVSGAVKSNAAIWARAGSNLGQVFSDAFSAEVLAQGDSGLESVLNGWIESAKSIGAERTGGGNGRTGTRTGSGTGSGTGGSGSTVAAMLADLELLRDSIDRSLAELDRMYADGEVSLRDYFARKQELQEKAIDTAIAMARQELAVAKEQDAQQKALVQIEKLQRDRAAIGPAIAREQAQAERELANALDMVKAQIADLSGQTGAEAAERLKQELAEKLRQYAGSPEMQELLPKLFNLKAVEQQLQTLRTQVQDTMAGLAATESLMAAQQDAGMVDPTTAEQTLQAARERSIEQLSRYREALLALQAANPDNQAIANELANVDAQLATVSASMNKLALQARDQAINSLTTFFTDLASGSKSAGEALRDFVVNFVQGMAQIAARALATFLVLQMLDAIYPGLGKTVAAMGGQGASVLHNGGVVGRGGSRRNVDPALFLGAPRFHSGGLPGIKSDEVPAILQRGEEVLAKDDPRNVLNGGGRSGGSSGTRVINVIDPAMVQDYLDSPGGEEAILNVIGRNPGRVKQLVG